MIKGLVDRESACLRRVDLSWGVPTSSDGAKLFRANGLRPQRQETVKVGKAPAFAKKVDMVGLYLNPSGGAVVLSVDEKTRFRPSTASSPRSPSR